MWYVHKDSPTEQRNKKETGIDTHIHRRWIYDKDDIDSSDYSTKELEYRPSSLPHAILKRGAHLLSTLIQAQTFSDCQSFSQTAKNIKISPKKTLPSISTSKGKYISLT